MRGYGERVQTRLRLLRAATVLLYFGPLLAGLGGYGWGLVPVFVGLFLMWLVVLRPQDFPNTRTDWLRPQVLVVFAGRALVQLLLVLACLAIGRGIGGVFNDVFLFPAALPIGVSASALVFARLIWDPSQAAVMESLIERSLAQVEANLGPLQGGDRGYAEAVTGPLNGLPDDVGEDVLDRHLSAVCALVDEGATYDVLLARVQAGQASQAGKTALMLLASDGAALYRMARPHVPLQAMQALAGDAGLVARLAERLTVAVRRDPELWSTCPTSPDLAALGAALPEVRGALSALEAERPPQTLPE